MEPYSEQFGALQMKRVITGWDPAQKRIQSYPDNEQPIAGKFNKDGLQMFYPIMQLPFQYIWGDKDFG